jgi:hypothetical protein
MHNNHPRVLLTFGCAIAMFYEFAAQPFELPTKHSTRRRPGARHPRTQQLNCFSACTPAVYAATDLNGIMPTTFRRKATLT